MGVERCCATVGCEHCPLKRSLTIIGQKCGCLSSCKLGSFIVLKVCIFNCVTYSEKKNNERTTVRKLKPIKAFFGVE